MSEQAPGQPERKKKKKMREGRGEGGTVRHRQAQPRVGFESTVGREHHDGGRLHGVLRREPELAVIDSACDRHEGRKELKIHGMDTSTPKVALGFVQRGASLRTPVGCVVGSSDDVVPLQDVGRVWESFDVGHGLLEQLLQLLLQPLMMMIDTVPSSYLVINWTAHSFREFKTARLTVVN